MGQKEREASRPTILVVDDESLIRIYLREVLEEAGYTVLEAASGPAALALFSRAPHCAAVISDVDMPGAFDGVALVRAVRSASPGLPVILISGRRLPQPSALPPKALFLAKPFPADHLLVLLSEALGED